MRKKLKLLLGLFTIISLSSCFDASFPKYTTCIFDNLSLENRKEPVFVCIDPSEKEEIIHYRSKKVSLLVGTFPEDYAKLQEWMKKKAESCR